MPMEPSGPAHWTPAPDDDALLADLTLGALLDEAVAAAPGREAIVLSAYADRGLNARWTYRELRERAHRVGRALLAGGVQAGDRVAVWATNVADWVALQFGIAYAGAVLVPLNPLYREREVRDLLTRSGARLCFAQPTDRGTSLWDILNAAVAGLAEPPALVALDGTGFEAWLAGGDGVDPAALDARAGAVRPGDVAQVQFTSGTTGRAKGVMLTHHSIVNDGIVYSRLAGMREGGRHLNPMPFFHCGGCVMATLGCVATRSTQLPLPTFDAARAIATIDGEGATSTTLVPTMMLAIEQELERGGGSLGSLELLLSGGTMVPEPLVRRWVERFGVAFSMVYGQTEASPAITMSHQGDPYDKRVGTCGRPLPGVEVDVVAVGTDERVAVGEEGEIRARGWPIMLGYWDDEQATRNVISPDGFLHTGDLGRLDADGYFTITGRAKDLIIRGGENIDPAEVEDALRELDGVLDAAVIGVPSQRYGEEVAAYLRVAGGRALDAPAVAAAMAGRVARFKIPVEVHVVDAFPLTASGKVMKHELRARHAEPR